MNTKTFVKGAMILVVFNLIGKVLGAVYRIPLANILGPVGIGKYQLVFPLYSFLLSISVSGIPVAISKIVAEYNGQGRFDDAKKLLRISKLYLCFISLLAVVIITIFSKVIAKVQGNPGIYLCYYAIAPAILFVGILSVYRGYFQGNLNMIPTAISNIVEQVGKLILSLYFASYFIDRGVEFGVFGALLGISLSEFLALVFLSIYYLASKNKRRQQEPSVSGFLMSKQLFSTALPITLGGLMSPVTAIIDSLLVVNILIYSGFGSEYATSLLGLQSGIVDPIINIPIVISVSIVASLLPNLASAYSKKQHSEVKDLIEKALQITLSVSMICSICFVIFGKQILEFLYSSSLSNFELLTSTKLLFLGAINLLLLSLLQLSSGILHGMGYQKYTVKSLLIGSILKIVLTFALVSIRRLNIYGAMISGGISYLVVFILNYRQIYNATKARISNVVMNVLVQCCFVCLFAYFANRALTMMLGGRFALLIGGSISGIIFLVTYFALFLKDRKKRYSS